MNIVIGHAGRLAQMMVVRGTKKFIECVGDAVDDPPPATGMLGDWYAHVWVWRPQVALFVNERTLYPVLLPLDPTDTLLDRFPDAFVAAVSRAGPDLLALDDELRTMEQRAIARTDNRSVLGVMNEFAHLVDNYRWLNNDSVDFAELAYWLAQVNLGPLAEGTPEREIRAVMR